MKRILLVIMLGLLILACGGKKEQTTNIKEKDIVEKEILVTSLPPLKWTVEQIAGDDFSVISIIKPNMNHELFEPQPKDMKIMENSNLFFTYDTFHFEREISELMEGNKGELVMVLDGIDERLFLEGHGHEHGNHTHGEHNHKDKDNKDEDENNESIDPHVWFSLDMMPIIAENIKNKLIKFYPEKKEIFEENYVGFIKKIEDFKAETKVKMESKVKDHFISYHPTLAYFLKNYDIEEISVEYEGKEPSAKQIKEIIDEAKEHNVTTILVQPQFPKGSIEVISKEIKGAKIIEFNSDEENIFENLRKFIDALE